MLNYSFIREIKDNYGNILYKEKTKKEKVISDSIIYSMHELMLTPFNNDNYYTLPTLEKYGIKNYYGKSGSTQNDSYLIIFNDKYVIGVWLGKDNNDNLYDYTTTKYLTRDIINQIN